MEVFLVVSVLVAGNDRAIGSREPMKDIDACWHEAAKRSTELTSTAPALHIVRIRVGCEIKSNRSI